ncbi:helix-turn-helix domain-containing protein [Streptomyces sp. NBC_00019]|uniref:TetR/AcrR family transcriptional regulator n=1 Tax=Streptomyces sp. NBC_00019 TaxID=2975623 RepID=UPI002F91888C
MRPVTRRQADHHAARSAATRAQVMRTLERLLDSGEAFSEISVQRILEEAGMSRATFYAHFDSKSDVLVWLPDELWESLLASARRWAPGAGVDGPTGSPGSGGTAPTVAPQADLLPSDTRPHRRNSVP